MTENERLAITQTAFIRAQKNAKPPKNLTVSEWSDKYRRLSPENSAEAGAWRTRRTPYLKDFMDAFKDARVHRLTMVACSQLGKTEALLNLLGYVIDQDPGSAMWVGPTKEDMKDFSKRRITPLFRDTACLRRKIEKGTDNTLQKIYPGGMLKLVGSNSPTELASVPCRYVFCDERDRWARDAGGEGDPFGLVKARTTTFYNYKIVEVSTPTIKGRSQIEDAFLLGTQEYWETACPHCGEYRFITLKDIRFEHETKQVGGKKTYLVNDVKYCCPHCGCGSTELEIRKAKKKWTAKNPDAYKNGHRSFWLNGFVSPWNHWDDMILEFLQAQADPDKLKTVLNTKFGELWEDRGDVGDPEGMLDLREHYDAELPDGVLSLTCGVDTQDNRLEYEVVGYGRNRQTWGIARGFILGRPDTEDVWKQLDVIIDHTYTRKNGKGLKVSMTFCDSGGHFTQDVYRQTTARLGKRVFAIKGKGGESVPYVVPASKVDMVDINHNVIGKAYLYTIGVDAGKEKIMSALRIEGGENVSNSGKCHFPSNPDKGYDLNYFNGLLSERMVFRNNKWTWEKIPGHERNEALDCRNYANAAHEFLHIDEDVMERMLSGMEEQQKPQTVQKPVYRKQKRKDFIGGGDW